MMFFNASALNRLLVAVVIFSRAIVANAEERATVVFQYDLVFNVDRSLMCELQDVLAPQELVGKCQDLFDKVALVAPELNGYKVVRLESATLVSQNGKYFWDCIVQFYVRGQYFSDNVSTHMCRLTFAGNGVFFNWNVRVLEERLVPVESKKDKYLRSFFDMETDLGRNSRCSENEAKAIALDLCNKALESEDYDKSDPWAVLKSEELPLANGGIAWRIELCENSWLEYGVGLTVIVFNADVHSEVTVVDESITVNDGVYRITTTKGP